MSYSKGERKIYVGNLPPDIRTRDIEDLFIKYGKIVEIDLKNRRGPPFAFVEFEDELDAEDAVKGRDGYNYDGYALRVEFPRGGTGFGGRGGSGSGGGGRGEGGGGGGSFGSRGGFGGGRRFNMGGPPSRRSDYRVLVTGLPPTGSWQDLKDHMREAGDVGFADVYKDGSGVCEFLRYEDMKYAIKKLDDSKFRSHEGETSYVRVREDTGGRGSTNGRGRSRSRSFSPVARGTRGSPTYSPMRGSRSRSRSRSRR